MAPQKASLALALIGLSLVSCGTVKISQKMDKVYSLKLHDQEMTVDAANGGRILSFTYKGHDILTGKDVHRENYGSTFWVSPQMWRWPPSPTLDVKEYQAQIKGNTLVLTSAKDDQWGCSFVKRITPDPKVNAFSIEYEIVNTSDAIIKWAPWEVTRVPSGGTSFFEKGPETGFNWSSLSTEEKDGIVWYKWADPPRRGNPKIFSNGQGGWLAHTDGSVLYIKVFPDIDPTKAAPRENEVEIFASPIARYVELETQGEYKTLAPGESITWTVKWVITAADASWDEGKLLEAAKAIVSQMSD